MNPLLAEDFVAFCSHFGVPLFDHQREDFGTALRREGGRFVHRIAGVSWPRGDGKSWAAAAVGIWRLIAGRPGTHVLSTALDVEGAKVMLQHARAIRRGHRDLEAAIEVRANQLLVPSTGSRWTIGSREHTNTRGQHPDVAMNDETGWVRDDEQFASLLAGQASVVDPLMLVVSTVGRRRSGPLWTVKTLAEGGDASVCWRWSGENRSPLVTREFLDRQRRILLPAQYAREHQNAWIDAADSFTTAAEVDAAMGRDGWGEQAHGRPGAVYEAFIDLGVITDPTVIAVGHAEGGVAYIDRLVTFQGTRATPVQLVDVEREMLRLASVFHPMRKVRVESWQGISAVQRLQVRGLPVELFAPTAKAHADEWPVLAQALAGRTIVLPPHARLREELLNLVVEVGAQGVKVVDRGKVHQDHAVAVRGVVAALQRRPAGPTAAAVMPHEVNSAPLWQRAHFGRR